MVRWVKNPPATAPVTEARAPSRPGHWGKDPVWSSCMEVATEARVQSLAQELPPVTRGGNKIKLKIIKRHHRWNF